MNNKAIELIEEALELLMPKEAKLTLSEIVANGQKRIANAVESVVSKHEKEIDSKAIERCEINERLRESNQEMQIIRGRNYLAGLAAQSDLYYPEPVARYLDNQPSSRGLLGGWS